MSGQSAPKAPAGTQGKLAEALGPQATRRLGLFTTLPAQAMLAFVVLFPTIVTVYISLTWWTPLDGVSWIHASESWAWFDNYVEVFLDDKLAAALWRTLLIVVVAVAIQFFLGFGLAVLFVETFAMRSVYYTLLLMPMMVVPAVSGYMFLMLFQSTGPVNQILSWITGQPVQLVWLADSTLAVIAVIAADVWQWTPMMFLILLAGMMGVPEDQLRAAKLLGANWLQAFWWIALPRMKVVIAIAIGIRFIEGIKLFDIMYIMTRGGPGVATETLSLYIYKRTFGDLEWAYVAALGLTIVFVMSLATLIPFLVVKRRAAASASGADAQS